MATTLIHTTHNGTPSAATPIFSIKEICHLIIEQLPRRDVVSCLRVSQDVWTTAVQVLYRQVDVGTASLVGSKQCTLTRFNTYCESVRSVILKDSLVNLRDVPILDVSRVYPNVTSIRATFQVIYMKYQLLGVSGSVIFNGIVNNKWSTVELKFEGTPIAGCINLTDPSLLGRKSSRLGGHLTTLQFGPDSRSHFPESNPWALSDFVKDYSILHQLEVFHCATTLLSPQALALMINSAPNLHTITARMSLDKHPYDPSLLQASLNNSKISYLDIRTLGKVREGVPKSIMKDLRVLHTDDSHCLSSDSFGEQVSELAISIILGSFRCKYSAMEELHLWSTDLSSLKQVGYALSVVFLVGKTCQIHFHYTSSCDGYLVWPSYGAENKFWDAEVARLHGEIALLRSLLIPKVGWKQLKSDPSDEVKPSIMRG